METGRATKKDSSGLSVITNIINLKNASFTSHLAFSHMDDHRDLRALFVTSVAPSTSAATKGAALISFISYLITSPIASIKSFWIMFEKPENTVDVSKCIDNLSSFAARACKAST